MRTRLALLIALSVWAAGRAAADVKTFQVDPVHSTLQFRIRHLYTPFTGRFNGFSATITVDPEDLTSMKMVAEVDVLSIDTAHAGRDKHLRAPDFFDTSRFAKARFESTRTMKGEGDTVRVSGTMTIRDRTKEVTFVVRKLGYGPDMNKGHRAGFHLTTTIDRFEFGIGSSGKLPNGMEVLGNDVDLVADVEAIEVEAPRAAAQGESPPAPPAP